jgi:RND superfamily putative drug exporter
MTESVDSLRAAGGDRDASTRRGSIFGLIAGRRTKYLVLGLWLVAAVVAAGFAGKLQSVERNDLASSLPASAESTEVVKIQSSFGSADTLAAVVVYERPSGLTDADRAKIAGDAQVFARRTDLDRTVDGPTISGDGTAAQILVPLNLGPDSFNRAADAVTTIRQAARHDANGLTVHIAGPAGVTADQSEAVGGINTTLLLATVAVVVAILLITYRSPVLWLLPILSAGLALTAAQAAVYLLARYAHLTVTADSEAVLTILVFGAATDYALLLIARYREELHRHRDRHHAMAVALRRCAPAVIASALTVAAAMLCLPLAEMKATRGLGPVLAVGVLIGLAVMLTAFPALLVTAGRWIFWPARPRYATAERATAGWWTRFGNGIAQRPRLTWVATALVLGALAIGVTKLDATGLTSEESFRGTPDSVAGEQILAHHFTAGVGTPIVIVSRPNPADDVRAAVAATRGVDPGSLTPIGIHGDHAYLEATLTDPPGSHAAYATVDRVRDVVHAIPQADALVGGDTAIQLDIQRTARHDRNLLMPIVFAVVLAILVLLLRSLVAPLLLIATVVLSFGAALGASAFVFRNIFGFAGEDSSLPLYLFVFLVALGVDYNIFLMTRIREETTRHGTRAATIIGLAATGGVITSAGLVLAGTFAVLATLPLTVVVELGFAVALGILLDTLVVRSVLVTALSLDIGRYLWWPNRLFRTPDQAQRPQPDATQATTPALTGAAGSRPSD